MNAIRVYSIAVLSFATVIFGTLANADDTKPSGDANKPTQTANSKPNEGEPNATVTPPRNQPPEIVRINLKGFLPLLGEILQRQNKTLSVFDLKASKTITLNENDIASIENGLSEDDIVQHVGLGPYIAWRIKNILIIEGPGGRIVTITPTRIYINLGGRDGIVEGAKFRVFRHGESIIDPKTGENLGEERKLLGVLQVMEVTEKFSKCTRMGETETDLSVGDEVEVDAPKTKMIAVIPLVNVNGLESSGSRALTERLTNDIVIFGLSVIERSLLDKVMGELALQQTQLVDVATAQKIGKQIGAFVILTGTIAPKGNGQSDVNVRLINVSTGKILMAVSQPINNEWIQEPIVTPRGTQQPVVTSRSKRNYAATFEGKCVQGDVRQNVYFVHKGIRYYVSNWKYVTPFGLSGSNMLRVKQAEIDALPEGPNIDSVADMQGVLQQ